MRTVSRILIMLVLTVVVWIIEPAWLARNPVGAAPQNFDPNRVLCDNDFVVQTAVRAEQVQRLLEEADADLAEYRDPANGLQASEIIARAIESHVINYSYRLNPKLLLVKMEVESNTVWGQNRDDLDHEIFLGGNRMGTRVEWILFYGWPDDPSGIDATKKGFTNQVNNAVRILTSDFADLLADGKGRNGWTLGEPRSVVDAGVQQWVTPANAATAALYIYTPHVRNDKTNIYWAWNRYVGDTGCRDLLPGQGKDVLSATVLIIDVSGSMDSLDVSSGLLKIDAAKEAAQAIAEMIGAENQALGTNHQIGLVSFRDTASLEAALTADAGQVQNAISRLAADGGTNMGQGLSLANSQLAGVDPDRQRILILMSDGAANVGLTKQEILDGPVRDAANAGTCIYTVGFGDETVAEEDWRLHSDFLRQVAQAAPCGAYYDAAGAEQLRNVYIKLRHEALGRTIGELSGEVRQGETVTAGRVTVPANQGELYATLSWPGSMLDLVMTDPVGRKVDQNYPGASISTFERLVYLIVENPLAGEWLVSVMGREVPQGLTVYNAVLSVRERATVPSSGSGWLVAILMLALAAFFILLVAQSQRGRAGAGLQLVEGYGATRFMPLRRAAFNIGRDPRNDLVLSDDQVSRAHAQITRAAGGYVIQDLNSTNGTFVSGQRVRRAGLRDGDEIRIGDARLVFRSQRRS